MVSGVNVKKALGIVIQYWREILIGLLAVTFWYQNYSETRFVFGSQTIPALEIELADSQNKLRTCGDANKLLSGKIEASNVRIEEYKELTKELEEDVANLGADLKEERGRTTSAVEDILKDPTPQSCEKAMNYLRDAGKDLKW